MQKPLMKSCIDYLEPPSLICYYFSFQLDLEEEEILLLLVDGGDGYLSRKNIEGGFMCRPTTVKLAQKIRILGRFMILGGRHKCMTPKFVGIQWFLVAQMNITRATSVSLVNKPEYQQKQKNIINLFS